MKDKIKHIEVPEEIFELIKDLIDKLEENKFQLTDVTFDPKIMSFNKRNFFITKKGYEEWDKEGDLK